MNLDSKSFERLFAVLIAMSAALSGMAGFLAADATRDANVNGTLSVKWLTESAAASDRGMQIIMRDHQLISDAMVQESLGRELNDTTYFAIANELRNFTHAVQMGYLNFDGSGTAQYFYDGELAWEDFRYDMLADYYTYVQFSDEASKNAKSDMANANSYLLATVILAFGTVVAAVGVSMSNKPTRLVALAIVLIIIIVTGLFMLGIG